MMTEDVSQPVRLCSVGDITIGAARRFDVNGLEICVVRCEDGFHAVADQCSHEDYSLSEGEVDGTSCEIECWKHGSLFSLITGEPLTLPATQPIAVYEVIVDGDDVLVRLS
ncbi:MAG TPA: non-heme iron oxygenase ferredoxin subunit [Acidimicrobiales bacterium]|nr:non-heme iron oxygenase ferredoxin subunit [Acidimicrobiales bacterium]